MVDAVRMVEHGLAVRRQSGPRPRLGQRPGWVTELVMEALAAGEGSLRPQDVIRYAEGLHDRRIAPSSIRNCLREVASGPDGFVERVGYGRYRLRASFPR